MKKILMILLFTFILTGCEYLDNEEEPIICTPEQFLNEDGFCENVVITCPDGKVLEDGVCVDEIPTCANDEELVDGECKKIVNCVPGYSEVDGKCVKDIPTCEYDQELVDGECVDLVPDCPDGKVVVDGVCVPEDQVSAGPDYEYPDVPAYEGRDLVTDSCSHLDNIGEWQPVWCDEFEYTGLPDSTLWNYDTGGHGWGNGESQYYKYADPDNAYVENGKLTITAIKENHSGSSYTSTRLVSRDKGDWLYGKIQVRAKLPGGTGTWPAIWMLPTDWEYGNWPHSGEIDIMEYVGYDKNRVHTTIHTGAFNHSLNTQIGVSKTIEDPENLFHVYEIEWEPGVIRTMINGKLWKTFEFDPEESFNVDNFEAWPFDKDFHLLLNIAIGGAWGGVNGIDDSIFPQEFVIDYVRVFQKDYAGMDESAPESVTGYDVLKTSANEVYLMWDKAVDDVMVEFYEIYVDDVLVKTTTLNGEKIESLSPSTTYTVKVVAVDFAGNKSAETSFEITTSEPPTQLTRIEAENFTVMSGIQLEGTSDSGGGQNVGWVDSGDFLTYDVTFTVSGTFTMDLRTASPNGGDVDVYVDGVKVTTITAPNSGGWQNWRTTTSSSFDVTAGDHEIKLVFVGSGINVNYFEFN